MTLLSELVVSRASTTFRRRAGVVVVAIFSLLLASAGYWAFWHHHAKRFFEVREGVFYRLAQPSEFGLEYLVKHLGVKTVLSVQLYDFRLHRGIVSFGRPDGCRESEYVKQLGAQPVQWPMGVEKSWPWLTPWQFEEFFKLIDDPANWPIAVHCQGGRHRTGTLSALFRLEYDRWPVDKVLDEMYGFKFGGAIRLQECNLRTYLPRPHPNATEWAALNGYWAPRLGDRKVADYEELVRAVRAARHRGPQVDDALASYLQDRRAFSLPLAQRVIDEAIAPLAPLAAERAAEALEDPEAGRASWSMAAALVADFGTPDQQRRLIELLSDTALQRASPERFDSLVDGATNRYTPNRIPYLRPLLDNEACHLRPGAQQCRYCDTAVARLSAIVDENFPDVMPGWGIDAWNNGRVAARAWLDAHPDDCRLGVLKPPTGHTEVLPGDPPQREDLSKARL
ncbi:MAG TPA: tyrosine-protein phosphatase [Pirellulales bacterium]|nr:tyrosine-protein phosphatase [Pirellulales bacterium]